jgi:ribosomal protein S27AE
MENRTKHTYRTHLYDFIKDVLVVCPNCGSKALVNTGGYTVFQPEALNIRVVCGKCGYNKVLERLSTRSKHLIIGAPIDPFFHLPLWLQAEIGNELLWAYNLEHLDFLAQHIGAKLRERNGFKYQVKSIGAKLPRWMTAAKRREEVLKAIDKLKNKQ